MNTEIDAAQTPSLLISQALDAGIKSISDNIVDLKNSKSSKRLNYSRAVQCVPLPSWIRGRKDLEICDIVPTSDGGHILVVIRSSSDAKNNFLLLYALDQSSKVHKLPFFFII